ncbi:MAG: hypothetical protein LBT92_03500 [Rickettsiales bacterium]|jgi:hypothetical protein|nr:hypothetical protein [Rickettsiales bacterium]
MVIFLNNIINGRLVQSSRLDCNYRCPHWDGCSGHFSKRKGGRTEVTCRLVFAEKRAFLECASPAFDKSMKVYGSIRDEVKYVSLVLAAKRDGRV